ncbi:nucleoside triphosphate pyrophosphatase [uncultured Sphaerochaeta sp.]|uniref:Maf family protein n=1 Tax=uncultured Sphaerochaeta sp. TaxID=886478 RepID=UPI002A0A66E9|nr:nucleoside triphosphate pyrophosphatase [uncultured Sphaerochaeta sp.]
MADFATLLPSMILASGSVARKALLESLGVTVKVFKTGCDETHDETDPAIVTELLARRKLASFQDIHPVYEMPVLCCDTMISFQGSLIGKPKDRQEAFSQLCLFDGNTHEVHSGWALWYHERVMSGTDLAVVSFKQLGPEPIASYLETGEWKGAAGSYRLQGAGRDLVERIEGDEATVIGLPLLQISEILGAPLSV